MSEHKYLRNRGGCWHVDFRLPAESELGKKRIRISLQTEDESRALDIRDECVLPLLRKSGRLAFLRSLSRMITDAVEDLTDEEAKFCDSMGLLSGKGAGITLAELVQLYIQHFDKTNHAPATVQKYRAAVNGFQTIVGSDKCAEDIDDSDFRLYRDTCLTLRQGWQKAKNRDAHSDAPLLNPRSINTAIAKVRNMFQWAMQEGVLNRASVPGVSVRAETAGTATKHKTAPSASLADTMCAMPNHIGKWVDAWQYVPVIARYTGCRFTEIVTLHAEDVRMVEGVQVIDIHRKTKNQSSKRLIPVSKKLRPVIKKLLKNTPSGRLFTDVGDWESPSESTRYGHYFLKAWNSAIKKVDGAEKMSFHCWRVYANNEMANGEVDIIDRERILGHTNSSTQASYTPRDLTRYRTAINKIR